MLIFEMYDKIKHNITGKILLTIEISSLINQGYSIDKVLTQKKYLEPIYDDMLYYSNSNIKSGNSQIWLALENNKIQGFIMSFFSISGKSQFIPEYIKDNQYFISSLYVLNQSQKKGIGSKLLNLVIDNCKLNHLDTIYISVDKENNSLNFYKKHNFKFIDINIGEMYLMNKKLILN